MSVNAQSVETGTLSMIRVDAAHRVHSGSTPDEASPKSVADPQSAEMVDCLESIDAAEQIRIQAGQLARHLQDRRRDVEYRETQLNARVAQLENDTRNSRLWLHERTEEFSRREADLSEQFAELESRMRGLVAAEAALDQSRQHVADQTQALVEGQQCLADEVANLQAMREKLEQDRQDVDATLEEARKPLMEHREALQRLQQQLDEQQRSLDEQWEDLRRQRENMHQEVAAAAEQVIGERQSLAQQRQQLELQQHLQQRTWQSQRERIDQRHTALERTRADILNLHREALEMRLVTEQLWTQLTGNVPAGELTQGLSRLRSQLGDEYRFAQQELANQREALEALIPRLDEKQQSLVAQRDELVGWFERRHRDLTEQAAQLAQRERLFEEDRQRHAELQQHWQATKRELEHQVHKLTSQLRRVESESVLSAFQ